MKIVDFIPVCGSMKYRRRRGTYHKLKSGKEVSDDCSENVAMLGPKNVKMVEVIPKVQPKMIRLLSINLWKRLRDAYVHGMLSLAVHVAHLNNGEICFFKKIHDDDDDVDLYLRKLHEIKLD